MNPITIRFSTDADRKRILELAELDGRGAPQGDVLLAEADGRLVAAVGVADGSSVADPFLLTGEVLDVLKLRAEQERERTLGRGPLLGRLMLIRQSRRSNRLNGLSRPAVRARRPRRARTRASSARARPHGAR
jgi:hypothetical protein